MSKKKELQKGVSLIMKIIVFVSAMWGTIISALASRNSFMGGHSVFMYFTIQSNIALALICLAGIICILKKKTVGRVGQIIKFMGTVSITLTGIVFCFVLAPTMGGAAWNLANILTHVIVPIVSVIDFFIVGVDYQYQKRDDIWILIPPILYAIYAGIAYVKEWEFAPGIHYPYFFLNWGSKAGAFGFCDELPFMGCGWWILALFIFLLLVGALYLWILKCIRKIAE